MRKCDQVRMARNQFVQKYGRDTLRALSVINSQVNGKTVDTTVSTRSLATYKANLTRGVYAPFVGPGFQDDTLNLSTYRG